jgi:cytochrome c oxidase assembly factor CtaG
VLHWTLDPVLQPLFLGLAALYVRAVRVLARRGYEVPRGQQISWWVGLALVCLGLFSPVDHYSDDLLSMHMTQHLLLGDIAAPFLVAGIRSPVLLFLLPKPVLVPLARSWLRRAFRVVRRPLVALPIYVAGLYGWHFAATFDAAAGHPAIHALQHETFTLINVLLWWAVLEPKKRTMPGDLWKIGYIFAARMFSMFLGVGLIFSRHAWFASYYQDRARLHGLSPVSDQQIAGGLMMTLDIVIMFAALCFFFWKASVAADRDERTELMGAPT